MKRILLSFLFVFLSVALYAAPEFGAHFYALSNNSYITKLELPYGPGFSPMVIQLTAGDVICGAVYGNDESGVSYHYAPNASSSASASGSILCNMSYGTQMTPDLGVTITESGTYIINFDENTQTLSWTVAQKIEIAGINYYLIENTNTAEVTSGAYSGSVDIPASIIHNDNTYSVTSIGNGAFSGCTNLNSVTIPASVTSIGMYAFYGCTGLTSLSIPNSVTSIGLEAFSECTGLTSITLSNRTTKLYGVFWGCIGLESVIIPDGVTCIDGTFDRCSGLTSVRIPNSVTSLDGAFANCTSLTSLIIPNSVTSLNRTFNGCTSLTSITIPNSVTKIGNDAFKDCVGLTSINIPNNVTSIGYHAFYGCSNLTDVFAYMDMPLSISTYDKVFENVDLANAALHVPNEAIEAYQAAEIWKDFGAIVGNNDVDYADMIATAEADKFKTDNAEILGKTTMIVMPSDMDAINKALTDYDKLSVAAKSKLPNGEKVLLDSLKAKAEAQKVEINGIYYYLIENTKTAEVTHEGSSVSGNVKYSGSVNIPESITYNNNTYSVTSIGIGAFYECTNMNSVTIPNSVISVGLYAFYGCSGLTSLLIPNSVITIGDYAFLDCIGLSSVTLSNSTGNMGNSIFGGCTGLESIVIPHGITSLGNGMFSNCSNLTSVTIPSSVTELNGTFAGCSGLTSITIPNSVSSLEGTFSGCSNLTSVIIPNSVTKIGLDSFRGCLGLTSVNIPSGVTFIGAQAFYGCSGLTDVYDYVNTPLSIYEYHFYGVNLTNVTLHVPNGAISAYQAADIWKNFGTIIGNNDVEYSDAIAIAEADKFKADNTTILGKTTATVLSSDITAINKALTDYDKLSEAAKSKLANGEKTLLDALKTKAVELKAAEDAETAAIAEADKFQTDYAAILGKTTSTVSFSDLIVIYKALVDYDKLSEKTKDMLFGKKELLDELREKAEGIRNYDINGDNKITITDVTTLIDVIVNQ